jgi:carboxymethylenebutenolidase
MRRLSLLWSCAVLLGLSVAAAPHARPAARPAALEPPSTVHLATADGGTDAFVAWPTGAGESPAVIVIHEWWGLNGQIKDIARRLARQGYVAIVPDLYHGKVAEDPERAHELMRGLEDTRVMTELDAARVWLRAQPRCAKARIGVVGFCVGGGISLRFALRGGDLAAAAMFYGPPETDPEKLTGLEAPLMGHFGADDEGIGPDRVAVFRTALQKAGKSAEIYVYSGAGHAFMHEGLPSYRADAARVAWARTLAFFQKHLKG